MASGEQIEAWVDEAVRSLKEKIGKDIQIVVAAMDGATGAYIVQHWGTPIHKAWLLVAIDSQVRPSLLPKLTIDRKDS